MDVYTVNLGGVYHDDFYTKPNIIAAYKARYCNLTACFERAKPVVYRNMSKL